jgi:RNA recognition motif-containing protein
MAQKLYVGGLNFNTTEAELRNFFAQAGTVVSANVVIDKYSGRSRGFGFVEMASAEEAQQAIADLNGRELAGRLVNVALANPKGSGTGAGQAGRGRRSWR